METPPQTQPAPATNPGYLRLPPETEYYVEPIFSVKFVIFAVVVIGIATLCGFIKSGRISLDKYFEAANRAVGPSAPAASGPMFHSIPAPPAAPATAPVAPAPVIHAAPVAPPAPVNPSAFVVTSISIGQPSIAIINGVSHVEGDPVSAPGVTGWKIRRITDDTVVLQYGSTLCTLPLSTPGMKPLDDTLKPLN